MKKILLLFVLLDMVFVGVILKMNPSPQRQQRFVAETADTGLTEGQTQKLNLIQNLVFSKTDQKITLQTDYLQLICESAALITLKFKATDVAVSGQPPQISHTHSCANLQQNIASNWLETDTADFQALHRRDDIAGLKAHALFRDEEFPQHWTLFEIQISGELNFTIHEAELNQFSSQNFNFQF